MPFTLTMPKLSPTMEEGTLVKWHKAVGDFVESGDLLFEVTTDKATVEHQALDEGYLRQILIAEGQEAVVNQPVAVMSVEKDENLDNYHPVNPSQDLPKIDTSSKSDFVDQLKPVSDNSQVSLKAERTGLIMPKFVPEPPIEDAVFLFPRTEIESRIKATPLAKKIAVEKGLDLTSVQGTGPGGRIIKEDLNRAIQKSNTGIAAREKPLLPAGSYEEEALNPIRKVVGQRLQESKTFIPHFYVTQIIDAEPIFSTYSEIKSMGLKISINDLIVRACALCLRQHPEINSGFNSESQKIIRFKTVDIAVAVSLENGLITPILRYADYKNIKEIAVELRELIQTAKSGKLIPSQFKGGSFTLSNLGMFGTSHFQAIINPPQAAILAVGAIRDVPVVKNSLVCPGKELHLALSVDHRVIDGAQAAGFLKSFKYLLENPTTLFL